MSGYEVVFIDLDETLFDFKRAEREALDGCFAEYGLPLGEETIAAYERINRALWARLESGEMDTASIRSERFRLLFEETGTPVDALAFGDSFVGWLSRGVYPLEGAERICAHLGARYELVVVTNGIGEVQRPRIAKSPIARHLRTIVVSEEAGCGKPRAEIFEYACRSIGFEDKAKMIMVGDSLSSDIQGGINFGIDTCWTNLRGLRNDTAIKPTYEVGSLLELSEIL